jgi:hypothetical protein
MWCCPWDRGWLRVLRLQAWFGDRAELVASGTESGSDGHQYGFRNSFVFVVVPEVIEQVVSQ